MTSIHAQSHTRTMPAGRTALALLTALVVTVATLAAAGAGTAHANGAPGGVVGSRERHTLGGVCWGGQEPLARSASIVPPCPPAMPGPAQVPDNGHEGRKPGAAAGSGA